MYQVVNNLALGATLIALVAGLWHDWSLLVTVKRMVISYLGFFILAGSMALAVKLVGVLEKDHPEQGPNDDKDKAGSSQA